MVDLKQQIVDCDIALAKAKIKVRLADRLGKLAVNRAIDKTADSYRTDDGDLPLMPNYYLENVRERYNAVFDRCAMDHQRLMDKRRSLVNRRLSE